MIDIPLGALVGALIVLILFSAFFSAAEIGLMTLNRYRLRHLAESGHRGARMAQRLLERPDRLLGIILLGNNFANIMASSVATLIALEVYGEAAIGIAAGLLTLIVLIFAEVAPKTFAALHPERMAYPAAYLLRPLLAVFYPLVWLVNVIANRLLRLVGVSVQSRPKEQLSPEELRAIVLEAGALMPESHQEMLLAILDLENVTVEEVMVPRGKIQGIDLDGDWTEVVAQLNGARHTRLPVYRGSLDQVAGMIHLRKVLNLMREGELEPESFRRALAEPYFIPQGTSLTRQLLNFKEAGRRTGLVVDEYGDIQGLVTIDDILEEIVGDFSLKTVGRAEDIRIEVDGSYIVRGTASLRDLNRRLGWGLPTDESRTLNGLIVEYLEDIPEPGTSLMLNGYMVEVLRARGTAVDVARIRPMAAAPPAAPPPEETST